MKNGENEDHLKNIPLNDTDCEEDSLDDEMIEYFNFDDDDFRYYEEIFDSEEDIPPLKNDRELNRSKRDIDTTNIYHKVTEYYSGILDQNKKYRSFIFWFSITFIFLIIGAAITVCCVLGRDLKKGVDILALIIPAFVSAFGTVIAIINCIVKYLFPQSEAKDVAEFVKTIVDKDKSK